MHEAVRLAVSIFESAEACHRLANGHSCSTRRTFLPSFIAGRGPAYVRTSVLRPYVTVQCGRGGELVSVCAMCV